MSSKRVVRMIAEGAPRGAVAGRDWHDEERWFLVVLVAPDGRATGALSRRLPSAAGEPFEGPWGLLTEEEAEDLAEIWNDDDREPKVPGENAQVVEVFRFDGDPVWTEA